MKLNAKRRRNLPNKDFAGPHRSYPIMDKAHARAALSRVSANGTQAEKIEVRRKVHKKFPGIGEGGHHKKGHKKHSRRKISTRKG